MSHYSRLLKIVIDVPASTHDREVSFWGEALGVELPPRFGGDIYHGGYLHGQDIVLLTQRLESGSPRVHLDIHTDDLDAEVARLERLGAERVEWVERWWIMRDPAGLPFCVLPARPGSLTDDNARRWD